jgi:hypothetical protein
MEEETNQRGYLFSKGYWAFKTGVASCILSAALLIASTGSFLLAKYNTKQEENKVSIRNLEKELLEDDSPEKLSLDQIIGLYAAGSAGFSHFCLFVHGAKHGFRRDNQQT